MIISLKSCIIYHLLQERVNKMRKSSRVKRDIYPFLQMIL